MASDTSVVFNLIAKDKATEEVQSAAKSIGAAAGVAGAAGGLALAAGMVGALNAEAVNDKVAASMGLTPAQQEAAGSAAGKLFAGAYAADMGQASEAVGAVMSSIDGMRDASEEALADTTEKALNFAKAFDVEVADAVGQVGVLMKSGLAKDANEAFDLMTSASQKVPAALRADLGEATNEYAKHFTTLGFDGAEAMGVLVEASKSGAIGLDKAGDALKEFSLRATDMSSTSTAAYQALGLDAKTMANQILAGGETARGATAQIAEGLLSIQDPADRANTAIALFGTPIEDMALDQIPAFLESLTNTSGALTDVAGSADRMGETLNDNAQARIDAIRNSVTLWTQSLIATDGPVGTAAAGVAVFGTGALAAGSQVAMLAVAMKGSGIAASAMAAMTSASMVIATVATKAYALATMAMSVASSIAAIALKGVGIAVRFALGPIGLIITGIALLVAGLIYAYKNSDTFRAIVQGAMRAAGLAFTYLFGRAKAVFGWLSANWPRIKAVIVTPVKTAVSFVKTAFNGMVSLVQGIPGRISRAASGMWNGITSSFKGAINAIIGGWNRLSFGIPGFSVGPVSYGGFSMSPPNIPYLAKGGIVTSATLAMIGEGRGPEAVIPLDRAGEFGFGGGNGRVTLEVVGGGAAEQFMVEMLRRFVRVRGSGSVQKALGSA